MRDNRGRGWQLACSLGAGLPRSASRPSRHGELPGARYPTSSTVTPRERAGVRSRHGNDPLPAGFPSAESFFPPNLKWTPTLVPNVTPRRMNLAPNARVVSGRRLKMGSRMYSMVHRAAAADGADRISQSCRPDAGRRWPTSRSTRDGGSAWPTPCSPRPPGEQGKGGVVPADHHRPFAVIAHPLIGLRPRPGAARPSRRPVDVVSAAAGLAVLLIMNYDGATGSYPSWCSTLARSGDDGVVQVVLGAPAVR